MGASRRGRRRRAGAAAVEMAIVLPLFISVILGTIEATRLGMVSQLLHVAAREGCRTAVREGQTTATVRARIDAVLAGSGITPAIQVSSPAGDWTTAKAPNRVTVRLSVPFDQVSWLGDPFAFGGTSVVASATMCSEKNG
ncbi:TadE/TadG family type IV pilus assembly protein [Tautonia plasticadhaerens]|uniref:TadE-like protein n=1 Tax=Tautonia plasticadhaerens TaxID=2527974 RepID=A0A518H537_9BACT|nr:TadE/TadG family type IV pilus assembly protein [Tautonia plasticadhaerens]QDV35960.1 TadE-like protein [Tautonia plasticadhaerens]